MQVFPIRENLGTLSKIGNTIVQLSASTLTLGARQYSNTSNITADLTVSGIGGLDSGSAAASTLYYIYAVENLDALALILSTSANGPSGYNNFKELGKIFTDNSIIFDDPVAVGGEFFQRLIIGQSTNALLSTNGEHRYNLATAVMIKKGTGLFTLVDNPVDNSGRTEAKVLVQKAKVSMNSQGPANVNTGRLFAKNGTGIIMGNTWGSGSGNHSAANLTNDSAILNDFYTVGTSGTGRQVGGGDGWTTIISLAAHLEWHIEMTAKYEDVI